MHVNTKPNLSNRILLTAYCSVTIQLSIHFFYFTTDCFDGECHGIHSIEIS